MFERLMQKKLWLGICVVFCLWMIGCSALPVSSNPKFVPGDHPSQQPKYHLRRQPMEVSKNDLRLTTTEFIRNEFRDNGDGTISDHATGLMWQKSGSDRLVSYQDAKAYVRELELAGHSDWRLPTVDELKSLMTSEKQSQSMNYYINEIFDASYALCWTSDKHASGGAWYVDFSKGLISCCHVYLFARAVRSLQ